jgi:thiamine-monophosphate kinase
MQLPRRADGAQIARASGVHLQVRLDALPLYAGVTEISVELKTAPWQLAATAGEDYELCFCASAADRTRVEQAVNELGAVEVTWIGEVCGEPARLTLSDERGEIPGIEGFEHRV